MAQSTIKKDVMGLENSFVQFGAIDAASFTDGAYDLTFPKAFGSAPSVFCTANAGAADTLTTVGVSGVKSTGCHLQIVRYKNSVFTGNLAVRWLAVGTKP